MSWVMFRSPSCSCQMTSRLILRLKWTTIYLISKSTIYRVCFPKNYETVKYFQCAVPSHFLNNTCSVFFCLHRENMPSHFKFKEYCPLVFRNLRERFGIDDQDFLVWKLLYIHRRQISLAALVMPLGQISTFFCHLCFRRCELPHKRASYLLETIAILVQVYILKCFFTIWCCNDTDEKQM